MVSLSGRRTMSVTLLRAAGEEHGRLAGRIAAADQRHVLTGGKVGLERRRPIVDGCPLEFFQPFNP